MKIAIIGAGPRGLMTLERLVARHNRDHFPLSVTLYDPAGIGGMVWQPEQPLALIMNTIPIQITLFTDASVTLSGGPLTTGPNLYEWSKQVAPDWLPKQTWSTTQALRREAAQLSERGYATRALYGAYNQWFYEFVRGQAADADITFQPAQVTDLQWQSPTAVRLTADRQHTTVNGVVMALGYSENKLTDEQEKFARHAAQNDLLYIPQRNPADAAPLLKKIEVNNKNGERIILRGLGLSFFDYVTLLTTGRGGTFAADKDGRLTYRPAGNEPHIYASSRGGFPYRAKGYNQKADGEEDVPQFLTPAKLAEWQAAGHVSGLTFWHLLQAEVEYVYYSLLVQEQYPAIDLAQLQAAMRATAHPTRSANQFGVPAAQLWDWPSLINPAQNTDAASFPRYIQDYLTRDYTEAARGTKTGPLTSALEVFRDMRDPIRQVVEKGLLSDTDYWQIFLKEFQPINDFLSIGPPAHRIQELAALVSAGIVTLVGPAMVVETEPLGFTVRSLKYPARQYRASSLIEARLPAVNYPTADNPLIQSLNKNGLLQPHTLHLNDQIQPTGAISVDRQTDALITAASDPLANVYLYGVPTEGLHWLTTASPRPDVNDVTLKETDALVNALVGQLTRSED